MVIDNRLLDSLLEKAKVSPLLRQNFDLRTSVDDTSQRMMNALKPGTEVPINRHEDTTETVICICGRLEEIFYEDIGNQEYRETARYLLCPTEGQYGIQIPKGVWHTICVIEPSVIFEAKDGAYLK